MDLVEWVRAELEARGMKHKAYGDHMEWSSSALSRFMNHQKELSAGELMKTIRFLGFPLPEYLGGEKPAETDASAFSRLAEDLDEEQLQALLVYMKLLPKKGPR